MMPMVIGQKAIKGHGDFFSNENMVAPHSNGASPVFKQPNKKLIVLKPLKSVSPLGQRNGGFQG